MIHQTPAMEIRSLADMALNQTARTKVACTTLVCLRGVNSFDLAIVTYTGRRIIDNVSFTS
jgi:hypothetical protein